MESSSTAATVEKALDVLYHLHAAAHPEGVTGIGRSLGLPKSTVHRLLAALGSRGLVERDADAKYTPGRALIALGLGVLEREPVVALSRDILVEQARALGETIFLAAARGGRLIVLSKQEGGGFLRAAPRVGEEIPVHATATGKLYLAFAPDEVAAAVDVGRSFTSRTRTGRHRVERESARVRARGFAENREEWVEGLVGLAAPVHHGGMLHAAIAVAGPRVRMPLALRDRTVQSLWRAARQIEDRLAGRRGAVAR